MLLGQRSRGGALDIGAGGSSLNDIWVIGQDTDSMGNGNIYHLDAAVNIFRKINIRRLRIVSNLGLALVVAANAKGEVYRLDQAADFWERKGTVLASDIAVGLDGVAFITGTIRSGCDGQRPLSVQVEQ